MMKLKKRIDVIYLALLVSLVLHLVVVLTVWASKPSFKNKENSTYILSSVLNHKSKGENKKKKIIAKGVSPEGSKTEVRLEVKEENFNSQIGGAATNNRANDFDFFFQMSER